MNYHKYKAVQQTWRALNIDASRKKRGTNKVKQQRTKHGQEGLISVQAN